MVQKRVEVGSCVDFGKGFVFFFGFTLPSLYHVVACFSVVSCAAQSDFEKKAVFPENISFAIVRKAFGVTVPVTTVILEERFCFSVVPVQSGTFHPTLATVAAHCVMNVNFAQFCLFFFQST